MTKSKFKDYEENIQTGSPCSHADCLTSTKKPCPYCGRISMRGNVLIQNRTGPVHLERLNKFNKDTHIKLNQEEQEQATIKLWIAPSIGY